MGVQEEEGADEHGMGVQEEEGADEHGVDMLEEGMLCMEWAYMMRGGGVVH